MSETPIYCPLCKSKSHVGFVWQETHETYGHKGQVESFNVDCSACSCAVSGFKTKEEAIKSWNTRADQAVIDTLVEALENIRSTQEKTPVETYQTMEKIADSALRMVRAGISNAK